jgi:acetyltransferase EpsM
MYIFGASGHGKVLASMLQDLGIEIKGFFDDEPKDNRLLDIQVYNAEEYQNLKISEMIIGIGDNADRKKCALKYITKYATVIHPKAIVHRSVTINLGTVIMPGTVVNVDATIGKHCIINSGAIVEHDCSIEDFVHISPNAAIAGGVTVGEGTHIGIGANVIPGVIIGKWATIGAGAVVTKNVPDGAVVVGVPGKIIKINKF